MLLPIVSEWREIWQRSSNRWNFHGTDFGTRLQFGGGCSAWRLGIERDRTPSHAELSW